MDNFEEQMEIEIKKYNKIMFMLTLLNVFSLVANIVIGNWVTSIFTLFMILFMIFMWIDVNKKHDKKLAERLMDKLIE